MKKNGPVTIMTLLYLTIMAVIVLTRTYALTNGVKSWQTS